jgi:peptidoglycan/LPS O-acetylase OafA/YrhL
MNLRRVGIKILKILYLPNLINKSSRITMTYRKDIQILRGVSVLLVVLFHLEIGGFKSGFLGVDVFFVISGYLMAVLYQPDRKLEFFTKRAKRLLPAYFVVIMSVLIFCMSLTTPNDYNSVVKQALFATAFSSNIGYWLENSYFNKAAFNPLLHLWSLGVEIQFYLLLPLLFWIFNRLKGSYLIMLLGSLAACFFVVGISPKTSFFMVPLRLWEFLLGYGVAKHIPKLVAGKNSILSWLGAAFLVVLISIPMLSVDGEALGFMHSHPGINAMFVCTATAVILAVGLPPAIETLRIATVLEHLGQYSYSIYLVHFPVIVLFLYQPFMGTILKTSGYWQTLALISMIVVLSVLMYRYVEYPLRADKKTPKRIVAFAIVVLALCPLGVLLQKLIIPEKEMMVYQAWTDRSEYRCGKIKRILDPMAVSCEVTDALEKPIHRIILVGNSHADSIKTTFASVAQSKNISVRFMVDNEPLMAVNKITPEVLIDEAKSKNTDAIVLHYSPGAINLPTILRLVTLAKDNGITVSFILPVPVWKEHVPMALWKNIKRNEPLPSATIQDYRSKNRQLIDGLFKINEKNFKIYDIANYFCDGACKMVADTGKPLYFDGGHLTLTGSELLRGVFEQVISDLTAKGNAIIVTRHNPPDNYNLSYSIEPDYSNHSIT